MAKSKRNNIEVKLIRGNQRISNSTPPDVDLYKKLVEKGSLREEKKRPALVISRLDYAVQIKYGDSVLNISPRSKSTVADYEKLGELPNGLVMKKLVKAAPPSNVTVTDEK